MYESIYLKNICNFNFLQVLGENQSRPTLKLKTSLVGYFN